MEAAATSDFENLRKNPLGNAQRISEGVLLSAEKRGLILQNLSLRATPIHSATA